MITRVRHAARLVRTLTIVTAAWFVAASPVWAQPQPQMGATNKSYVLPYLMVILVTALGLLVVLRPSARKGGSRPKTDS